VAVETTLKANRAGAWEDDEVVRREAARRQATRHSRRVRRLKVVLPIAGGVIVAGIAVTMLVSAIAPGFDIGALQLSSDGIVMANPHISGHDGKNRSYEVTAERAVQSILDPKQVRLEKVDARIKLGDGNWAAFTAGVGAYDGEKESLTLSDGIAIESNDGYRATLSDAKVDLRGGTVVSVTPIELTSDQAKIRAGAISVTDGGKAIVFSDGITVTINPAALKRASGNKEGEAAAPSASEIATDDVGATGSAPVQEKP